MLRMCNGPVSKYTSLKITFIPLRGLYFLLYLGWPKFVSKYKWVKENDMIASDCHEFILIIKVVLINDIKQFCSNAILSSKFSFLQKLHPCLCIDKIINVWSNSQYNYVICRRFCRKPKLSPFKRNEGKYEGFFFQVIHRDFRSDWTQWIGRSHGTLT